MGGIDRDLARQVAHMMRPLAARITNTGGRGVVTLVDDSEGVQRLQVKCNLEEVLEGTDGCEHLQPYGFFSVPLPGAQAAILFLNGDRSHPIVVVAADGRYRAKGGQPGEAGLRTDEGDEIRLGRGHVVTITSNTIKLGSSSAAGDVVVQAALTGAQGFMAALDTAITATGSPANAPLVQLKTALLALNGSTGWKAGTSKAKAE